MMSLMKMNALVCTRLADGFDHVVLKEVAIPTPGPGEALVQVRAASLNFPDLLMLRGAYQHRPEPPFTPGMDFAGEVAAVGAGVETVQPGDRVAGGLKTGAFAEFVAAPASAIAPIPDRMDFAEAAAYPAAYLTAYVTLVERAKLQPGETALVLGASGGVGLACVDVARLLGARVIAGTGDGEKAQALLDYGADAAIRADQGFREEVKALTNGRGADVIVDPVGGEAFEEACRCIAFDGRLMVVGFASGDNSRTARANLVLIKAFSVMGVRAGEYGRVYPEKGAAARETIWRWAAEGRTRPKVFAEFPLARWRDAFELMAGRKLVGKVVLRPA
jgi:NADPH:quinone reductase